MSVTAPVRAPEATVKPECLTRKVEIPRWTIANTSDSTLGCAASKNRSGKGKVSTHCRTGASGNT